MQIFDLVHDHGFRTGVVAGAVLLVIAVVIVLVSPRTPWPGGGDLLPLVGVSIVIAALVGLDSAGPSVVVGGRLVAGLGLLVIGPLVASLLPPIPVPTWVLTALGAVPGAVLVAWAASLTNDVDWVPPFVFVAIVVGGALVADFDRANEHAGLGPVLIAVSALAIYTALPDTEEVAAVAGAAIPLALLGAPRAMAALGAPGAFSVVGVLAWVAAVGGRARPGSVVGAVACIGVMLVEPLVRRVIPRRLRRSPTSPLSYQAILIVVLHAGLVAGTSRVAGLRTSGETAAGISALALAGAAVILLPLLVAWGGRADETPAPAPAPVGRAARRRARSRAPDVAARRGRAT